MKSTVNGGCQKVARPFPRFFARWACATCGSSLSTNQNLAPLPDARMDKVTLNTPASTKNQAISKVGCIDHAFLRGQHKTSKWQLLPWHNQWHTFDTAVAIGLLLVHSTLLLAGSIGSSLGCLQRVVVVVAVIRIENCAGTGKCDTMPRFSKRVLFLRHLNGLLIHNLKNRLCRSSADDDDDSIEEAKDAALASTIKRCKGKRHLFCPAKN